MQHVLTNAKRSGFISCAALGALAAAAMTGLASPATADVIYETNSPFGGFFGFIGFDVFQGQSVALRFEATGDFTLDRVGVWFMNNDESGGHPQVTLTLRNDNAKAGSIPGDQILEQWQFNVSAVGWDPQLEQMDSTAHPLLQAGHRYWIVAESSSGPFIDGVWCWAANESGFTSTCDGAISNCTWPPAMEGATVAAVIEGTPHVSGGTPGDINGDGVVNVNDLLMVINGWGNCPAAPAPCPADIAPAPSGNGVVDVNDLLMVINHWG